MTLQEIKNLKEITGLPFPIKSKKLKWEQLIVNNYIAIPIQSFASYYKTTRDVSIVDQENNEVGILCFTKELGTITWNELTSSQFIAFLAEASLTDINKEYKFSSNYIIIKEGFFTEYNKRYKETAALWGGFFHKKDGYDMSSYAIEVNEVKVADISFPSPIFLENLIRGIMLPFAFERYLKFYHLLELIFDFDVVSKIKNLDLLTDGKKIGELLTDYSKKEITRLIDILRSYCDDIPSIVTKLNQISAFDSIGMDIFFKFGSGKESNPLNGEEKKFLELLHYGFEEDGLRKAGIKFSGDYRSFIIKLSSYWIYRVRNSIAHNKLGEYILTKEHENFIVEFAEPLLKEVLMQAFKKTISKTV